MNRIVTIILTYNSEQFIEECLVAAGACRHTDLLVVDNASSDDTLKCVNKFKNVKVLAQNKNIGYAAGNNVGIRYAQQKGYAYALILNPDAILNESVLKSLSKRLDHNQKLAAISPLITYSDAETVWYAGAKILENRFEPVLQHYRRHISEVIEQGATQTDSLIGAALMVRLSVIPKIGLMDERYFLYCEETDWSLKMKQAGYNIACDFDVRMVHNVSASTGGEGSLLQTYYYTRNVLYLCKKFNPGKLAQEIQYRKGLYAGELKAAIKGPHRLFHARRLYYMKKAVRDFKLQKMGRMGYKF